MTEKISKNLGKNQVYAKRGFSILAKFEAKLAA